MVIKKESYSTGMKAIATSWNGLTYSVPKDKGIRIGLPKSFVSPNRGIFKEDQFYWDSYFIVLGLIDSEKVDLAKGMVDNLLHMFKRFSLVPARNRFYNTGISQVPFLTSMIMDIYHVDRDKKWLTDAMEVAENELKNYWMNGRSAEKHLVFKGLSRYCDHNITHSTAEQESGWDMTSRFNDHCLDYLPVDLNCCLYKYEIDLGRFYNIIEHKGKEQKYKKHAENRKRRINELMWNKSRGFFFDYDYKTGKQSGFYSLAGFYPMWSNLASPEQAMKMREKIKAFEHVGGLANTQHQDLSSDFKQWDYPNGWANQQWIAIKGLLNYGYRKDSERLAKKWLDLNMKVFKKTGKFWEKYDVIKCDVGREGRYPNQSGFGWTNAVFVKLVNEFFG